MVKDHRTNFESGNPSAVLDGDLDGFMKKKKKKKERGIVGLLFTIYCNVQLKTAKRQTYSVDHTEKIKRSGLCDCARVSCIQKWETIVCTRRPLKWCIKIISGKESTEDYLIRQQEKIRQENIFDKS